MIATQQLLILCLKLLQLLLKDLLSDSKTIKIRSFNLDLLSEVKYCVLLLLREFAKPLDLGTQEKILIEKLSLIFLIKIDLSPEWSDSLSVLVRLSIRNGNALVTFQEFPNAYRVIVRIGISKH